jgi:hypothetical protein
MNRHVGRNRAAHAVSFRGAFGRRDLRECRLAAHEVPRAARTVGRPEHVCARVRASPLRVNTALRRVLN